MLSELWHDSQAIEKSELRETETETERVRKPKGSEEHSWALACQREQRRRESCPHPDQDRSAQTQPKLSPMSWQLSSWGRHRG